MFSSGMSFFCTGNSFGSYWVSTCCVPASGMGSTASIDSGTWLRSMQRLTRLVVHEKRKKASNSPRFAMLTA